MVDNYRQGETLSNGVEIENSIGQLALGYSGNLLLITDQLQDGRFKVLRLNNEPNEPAKPYEEQIVSLKVIADLTALGRTLNVDFWKRAMNSKQVIEKSTGERHLILALNIQRVVLEDEKTKSIKSVPFDHFEETFSPRSLQTSPTQQQQTVSPVLDLINPPLPGFSKKTADEFGADGEDTSDVQKRVDRILDEMPRTVSDSDTQN